MGFNSGFKGLTHQDVLWTKIWYDTWMWNNVRGIGPGLL